MVPRVWARQTMFGSHDPRIVDGRRLIHLDEYARQWSNTAQFVVVLVRDDMPRGQLYRKPFHVVGNHTWMTMHLERCC